MPPGGGTDLMARAVAQQHGRDPRPERSSSRTGPVATARSAPLSVAQARPDGDTPALRDRQRDVAEAAAGGQPALRPRPRLRAGRRARHHARVRIAVHPERAGPNLANSWPWRARKPGRINVANSGIGGIMHLTAADLAVKAGVDSPTCPIAAPRLRWRMRRPGWWMPSSPAFRRCWRRRGRDGCASSPSPFPAQQRHPGGADPGGGGFRGLRHVEHRRPGSAARAPARVSPP